MWLSRLLGRRRDTTPEALESFLAARAAFVAQKTVLDYCRVKAGRQEREMFADPDFRRALQHCRWRTFAAAVQDVVAMAEAWLRPQQPGQAGALAAALAAMGGRILDAAPAPAEERDALDGARD
ncbi:hypothetical protein, partial [Falsiroseomonas oryzae]|uniref:hypothetical protein n=1 Tax=Falsiroseomonas oryzae TaxID=2766473 RepID=UPI0022EB77EF